MKVLFIENAGLLSAGAFRSLVTLITELRKLGVEGHVALPVTADAVYLLEKENIPYIQLQSCAYTRMISDSISSKEKFKMVFKDIAVKITAHKLAKYVKENRIDIVHDNTSVSYIGYYVAQIANIKHVWHFREFMEEDFNCHYWKKEQLLKLFNKSDANIAISKAIYDKYKDVIDNLQIIYNGIDIEKYYSKRKILFDKETVRALCVGRVCDGKGQKDLVKAAGVLYKKYGEKIKISLAGTYTDTEYQKIIKIAKEYGIEESVIFLGQCTNMTDVYADNDLICMVSKCEAFGRVTVEAMLSGCLALGADSGGTKEIITPETGIKFLAGANDDLVEKLHYIVNNKNQVSYLALAGQEDVKKRFSSIQNAMQVQKVYKTLTD